MNLSDLLISLAAKVGPQVNADGAVTTLRSSKDGGLVITPGHGMCAEAAIRKRMFYNHAPAVAMSAPATAAIGNIVWNPPDSGVLLALGKWSLANLVTDADALSFQLCYSAQSVVPTTTSGSTCGPCYIQAVGSGAGQAKGYGIATIQVAATPIWLMAHNTAAIQTVGVDQLQGDFEGAIIVPPGYLISIHTIAAAGTAGVSSSIMWEEIPI